MASFAPGYGWNSRPRATSISSTALRRAGSCIPSVNLGGADYRRVAKVRRTGSNGASIRRRTMARSDAVHPERRARHSTLPAGVITCIPGSVAEHTGTCVHGERHGQGVRAAVRGCSNPGGTAWETRRHPQGMAGGGDMTGTTRSRSRASRLPPGARPSHRRCATHAGGGDAARDQGNGVAAALRRTRSVRRAVCSPLPAPGAPHILPPAAARRSPGGGPPTPGGHRDRGSRERRRTPSRMATAFRRRDISAGSRHLLRRERRGGVVAGTRSAGDGSLVRGGPELPRLRD